MSSSLRLQGSEPIRVYPSDLAVWLTEVPTDEIADIIGDEAFGRLMKQYEKELQED
jgi:hypothetical protein